MRIGVRLTPWVAAAAGGWILAGGGRCAAAPLAPDPSYAEIGRRVARELAREHLIRAPLDNAMSSRAWTNFLSAIDFDRSFFTAEDVRGFRAFETLLDDQVKSGESTFAFDVTEILKARVAEREAFAKHFLASPIDLATNESYAWNRRDAAWPHAGAEYDALWRCKLKNDYLKVLLAREKAAAATAALTNSPAFTNIPDIAAVPAGTNSTSAAAGEEDDEGADDTRLSIEDSILKRYTQLRISLQDTDAEWVLQHYLSAFAQAYDPHSSYMSPSSVEDFDIEMKLSLVGIGALLRSEDGAAKVVSLIPGGPAARDTSENRLRPGDKIIAVAQGDAEARSVLHMPLHKVVRLIRGEKGTPVVLTVIPVSDPSGATTRRISLVRDEVKLEAQAASGKLHTAQGADGTTRKLGVIRLPTFYANMKVESADHPEYRSAADDVHKLIKDLAGQGMEGLILDLRSDGGGSLREAIRLAGLFITSGPIVQVRERYIVRVLPDDDPTIAYAGPMVVLVNRLSASASEIVAGALQDYRRALIVGDSKTHGKGTVQTVLELGKDGQKSFGSIKITTASYYRISGGSTQLRGIIPDIVLPSAWEYLDTGEEKLRNPIPWSQVRPAVYGPVSDLESFIPRVRQLSATRLQSDPQYQTYSSLLAKLAEVNKIKTLPLNLDERRRFTELESEMTRLQEKLESQAEGVEPADTEADGKKDSDVILTESLRILADLASVQKEPVRAGPVLPPLSVQQVVDWLKSGPETP